MPDGSDRPGEAFRAALEALSTQRFNRPPSAPREVATFGDLKARIAEQYPGANVNRQIASLLGFTNADGSLPPKGTERRRSYQSFMRTLQRRAPGEGATEARHGGANWLGQLGRQLGYPVRPPAPPRRSLYTTMRRIIDRGVRVGYGGGVKVSSDSRYRTPPDVPIEPGDADEWLGRAAEYVAEENWDRAADDFAMAWGEAYGIGQPVEWYDVDTLDLSWLDE